MPSPVAATTTTAKNKDYYKSSSESPEIIQNMAEL